MEFHNRVSNQILHRQFIINIVNISIYIYGTQIDYITNVCKKYPFYVYFIFLNSVLLYEGMQTYKPLYIFAYWIDKWVKDSKYRPHLKEG